MATVLASKIVYMYSLQWKFSGVGYVSLTVVISLFTQTFIDYRIQAEMNSMVPRGKKSNENTVKSWQDHETTKESMFEGVLMLLILIHD